MNGLRSIRPGVPRLYLEADMAAGNALCANSDTAHYLLRVLRLKDGDEVLLFNGRQGEWLARIGGAGKKDIRLICATQTRAQDDVPAIALLFAPIKRDHLDYMIQKASELGVRMLQPVITQRCTMRHVNGVRLAAIAREAAEQSERLTLPLLEPATLLSDALDRLGECVIFAGLEDLSGQSCMSAMAAHRGKGAAILTGPEGGFTPEEMTLLRNHAKVIPVHLGPRVLRADTAALAALSCWQAVCGDWSS